MNLPALNVLDNIKKESESAEKLFSLFVQRKPLTQDERDYENTVGIMMKFREELLSINEDSGREVYESAIAETIRLLCEKYEVLADLAENGRDILDRLLEAKHQRQNSSVQFIQDMHHRIYGLIGEIIAEIKNFDEFERSKDNKLMCLKNYFCRRLRQKLKEYI